MARPFLRLVRRIEREIFVGELEIFLKNGHYEGVIFALRQTGNGDGADASGAGEHDGKAAAVSGIVTQVEAGGAR